jgi:peptidoglycan hydrolase CwlO-like protein
VGSVVQAESAEEKGTMPEERGIAREARTAPAADVTWQILHLLDEIRDAFSATRAQLDGVSRSMDSVARRIDSLEGKVDELRGEIHEVRNEIATENQETRNFVRAVYEGIKQTIRTTGELRRRRAV